MNKNYKNSYKVKEKELISLSVYNVGFQKCQPLYQWGPGIRDHYLIHYIISGSGYYITQNQKFELHEGDTFLVYPNTQVTYYANSTSPWEYCWVGFSGTDAPIIMNSTDFTKGTPIIYNTPQGDIIKKYFLSIYEARGNEFQHAVRMTGQLYTALSLFMKHAKNQESLNSLQSYAHKGIAYINANYSYPITIKDIADYVGLSRSHLFRSFETALHLSPKEYLTNFRMKQACYLLEHSDLSINAIATSVGFENSLYFSKMFHKQKGVSPRSYKKKFMESLL